MVRFLSRVALAVSLFYSITAVAFLVLRGLPSQAPWWLDLANTFTLYLFIPGLPVMLLALLVFSRRTQLVCSLPLLLFVLLYGGLFIPRLKGTDAPGTPLTVMTHNVDGANKNSQRVAQAIIAADADIVALQELTDDMAEALVAQLSERYPYRVLLPLKEYDGVGVFSRFPIEREESYMIGHFAQHLVLDIDGRKVDFFNFHPLPPKIELNDRHSFPPYMIRGFDTRLQAKEIAAIVEKVSSATGSTIVAGDFNITDQSRPYSLITKNLTDTYREAGWGIGLTFPTYSKRIPFAFPLFRIDYLFHSAEIVGLEIRVGAETGSDHLPVIAKLRIR